MVYKWFTSARPGISMKGVVRDLGGTPKVWIIISFMRREDGVSSKDLSKDRMGRDPFRQLPDKFSSSLQLTPPSILFYVVCTMISK